MITLKSEWEDFEQKVCAGKVPPERIIEVQNVFFAGVQSALNLFATAIISLDTEIATTNEALKALADVLTATNNEIAEHFGFDNREES